ncbi:MAG: ABC transporter ATP-binding protein [Acetobacteraceae bacterium]|nr:ABC transporter ATP-binding protein [Acetobacteraceae bacterium]
MPSLIEVKDLSVEIGAKQAVLLALDRISFAIAHGEVLGLVGESGAGKSLTAAAIIRMLEAPARIAGGQVVLNGVRIDSISDNEMKRVRGRQIGTIFQNSLDALDPLYTVGQQLVETIRCHLPLSASQARKRAMEWLREVEFPEQRFYAYPHELSGGMRQRAAIALALCAEPYLLIADEPTTALDLPVQAQMVGLLKRLVQHKKMAALLVTHNLGLVALAADRIAVMYAGRIVEMGPTRAVVHRPAHPYTMGLLESIPPLSYRVRRLRQIAGTMPRLGAIPPGCPFSSRCNHVFARCHRARPELMTAQMTQAACWLHAESTCKPT